MFNFSVNPLKAVEALAYVARANPNLSQKYIAKVFFYAEKWHFNRFGRPIVSDTYIAMKQGPVPSAVRDLFTQDWKWLEKPENYDECIEIENRWGILYPKAKDTASFRRLSKTDLSCLDEAIEYCKDMDPDDLSNISHLERAWSETVRNKPMSYELFIDEDNPEREEILQIANEFSHVGVI